MAFFYVHLSSEYVRSSKAVQYTINGLSSLDLVHGLILHSARV